VLSRLAWARNRLRTRLTRRGLSCPRGCLPGVVFQELASKWVSPALLRSTVLAAIALAEGNELTNPALSAKAIALTNGMLRTMLLGKVISGGVVLLVLAALMAGAGTAAYHFGLPRSGTTKSSAPLESRDLVAVEKEIPLDRIPAVVSSAVKGEVPRSGHQGGR